jgi:hypothetical protein
MRSLAATLFLALSAFAACAAEVDEPAPKVKIADWLFERQRKDISGATGLVRASMKLQNISSDKIEELSARIVFYEGLGAKLRETPAFRLAEIKPGEALPLVIQDVFVPVFGSYELYLDYRCGKEKLSHRYQGSSPVTPPSLMTKKLLPRTAQVVVLGQEIIYDQRTRSANLAVRIKNLGELDASGVTLYMNFYDDKSKPIGKPLSGVIEAGPAGKPGVAKGGEDRIVRLTLQGLPQYSGFDIRVTFSEPPAWERLSGGEFQNKPEVEVAHLRFSAPEPGTGKMHVDAKVRNGLGEAVAGTVITFIFYEEKEETIKDEMRREFKEKKISPFKREPVEVPGRLNAGAVKEISFDVTGVAQFASFSYEVAYQAAETEKTPTTPQADDSGEVVVENVSAKKNGNVVVIKADVTNRRRSAAKDVNVTFELRRKNIEGVEETVHTVKHVIEGLTNPGETKSVELTVENPPAFTSYFYSVSYSEGGPAAPAAPQAGR